jgi:chromosome segregation ATPase
MLQCKNNRKKSLSRKKDQDMFEQKRSAWERMLEENKKQFEQEKQELETLRKTVATYEADREKAVKAACDVLQKSLEKDFSVKTQLREQETKAERDLLQLKLTTTQEENTRLTKDILELKKSLDHVSTELKDVAVRVIDANKPQPTIVTTQKSQEQTV